MGVNVEPTVDSRGLGFRELTFKNGKVLSGEILESDDWHFRIQSTSGTLDLYWNLVSNADVLTSSTYYHSTAIELLEREELDKAIDLGEQALDANSDLLLDRRLSELFEKHYLESIEADRMKREAQLHPIQIEMDKYVYRMALDLIKRELVNYPEDEDLLGLAVFCSFEIYQSEMKPLWQFTSK